MFSVVRCRNDILRRLTGLAERISCWTNSLSRFNRSTKWGEENYTFMFNSVHTDRYQCNQDGGKSKISRTGECLKVCRGLPQINNTLIFIVPCSQYPLPRPIPTIHSKHFPHRVFRLCAGARLYGPGSGDKYLQACVQSDRTIKTHSCRGPLTSKNTNRSSVFPPSWSP